MQVDIQLVQLTFQWFLMFPVQRSDVSLGSLSEHLAQIARHTLSSQQHLFKSRILATCRCASMLR